MNEFLAKGEAPDEVRNVFRQRSRWTKGHMEVFFSSKCPIINWKLSLANKWLYINGTWAYFATVITTPTFILVPFISLAFGIHPVVITRKFAVVATIYYACTWFVQNYCRSLPDNKSLWFSNVSNHVLCFTYFKAILNILMVKAGMKQGSGFKATTKAVRPPPSLLPPSARLPAACEPTLLSLCVVVLGTAQYTATIMPPDAVLNVHPTAVPRGKQMPPIRIHSSS
jgi:hypothetical protein